MDKHSDLVGLGNPTVALKVQTIGSNTTTVGETIDLRGYNTCYFSAIIGTMTDGDFEFQLFESNDSGMSGETQVGTTQYNGTIPDWDDHATESDSISDFQYLGIMRYVRVKVVSTNVSSGAPVGCTALQFNALHGPAGGTQAP